jgi:hypothetical protein
MRAGSVTAAVVLLVALAGCSTRLGGEPVAATSLPNRSGAPEPDDHTAAAMLGDLPTLAPCGLTDPAVFGSGGTADFATPESLDYCTISVKPQPGVEVVVSVGQLGRLSVTPGLPGTRIRDIDEDRYVTQSDDGAGYCTQTLVFPDDVTLDVSGTPYQGSPEDTCTLVTTAMDKVVEVVDGGEVGHRSPADDSFVGLDPCSLVGDDTVTALPGFTAAQRREYPARHQCYWETATGPDRLSIRLMFAAGPVPATGTAGAKSTPIGGRPTITTPYPDVGDAAYCAVESAHLPFDEVPGQAGMVELAEVYVRMPKGKVDQGCQAATAVATKVWPALPAP